MKPFIKYIAYLQVIGIILVVLGHSFHEYPDGNFGRSMLFYRMLFSFRMPVFLFVSGFLMVFTTRLRTPEARPSIGQFTYTKIKRLLLPFAFLTIVTFIPRTLLSDFADDGGAQLSILEIVRALVFTNRLVIPYFWFLHVSFILLVFNYAVITLGEKAGIKEIVIYGALIALFAALPYMNIIVRCYFSINEVIRLGVYFAIGAAFGRYHATLDRLIPWTSPLFLAGAATAWAALFSAAEGTPYIMLCSLCGIAMCISVAKLLERYHITVLDHLIGANYIIFLLSWYFNVAAQQGLHHFIALPWWCHSILSLTTGVYGPWLIYRFLQSHSDRRAVRFIAICLGQSLKNTRREPAN